MPYYDQRSYTKSNRALNSTGLSTQKFISTAKLDAAQFKFYEIEPGEVLDIILDETHPDYASPEDIGKAKVRLLYSQTDLNYNNEAGLKYAKPLDTLINSYPLKHEVVLCAYYISRENTSDNSGPILTPKVLYYSKTLKALNSVNHNAMLGISLTKEFKDTSGEYTIPSELILGNTFTENPNILNLRHNEGDYIFEGRSGNSIRLGSENGKGQNPILKIRNGQRADASGVLTEEDINLDNSSF